MSARPKPMLTSAEASVLLARGVPLDATVAPDDVLRGALAEGRVWSEYAFSSMGTADLHWEAEPATAEPASVRASGIVLPVGAPDPWPTREHSYDERNAIKWLWEPFWSNQCARLAAAIPDAQRDAMLDECARMLIVLERDRDMPRAKDETRASRDTLVDWLVTGGSLDSAQLAAELATHESSTLAHLVTGVRARWLKPSVEAAIAAVRRSAQRFDSHDDRRHDQDARLALLRFAAKLLAV